MHKKLHCTVPLKKYMFGYAMGVKFFVGIKTYKVEKENLAKTPLSNRQLE